MTNPYGLSPREVEVMDAMLGFGTIKAVAARLGIDYETVVEHLRHVRRKMQPPHKLAHFLMWHDWRRASRVVASKEEQTA